MHGAILRYVKRMVKIVGLDQEVIGSRPTSCLNNGVIRAVKHQFQRGLVVTSVCFRS